MLQISTILIGGPLDGKRVIVDDIPVIKQSIPNKISHPPPRRDTVIGSSGIAIYRREYFRDEGGDYPLYFHESISPRLLVLTMMDGYRREAGED